MTWRGTGWRKPNAGIYNLQCWASDPFGLPHWAGNGSIQKETVTSWIAPAQGRDRADLRAFSTSRTLQGPAMPGVPG